MDGETGYAAGSVTINPLESGRRTILDEARELVNAHARRDYGHPTKNFKDIARIWSIILGFNVTPYDIGLCMIGLKLARASHMRKRDNLVDIAGYAYTLEMIENKGERRSGGPVED